MSRSLVLGLILLCSCGDARYRLDGRIPPTSGRVALLDSAATGKVERLHLLFSSAQDSTERIAEREIADILSRLSESEDDLRSSRRRLNDASTRYRKTFERIKGFESFGGNRIFTDADQRVSTKNLLSEIADRFYKGKAFSLETGGEIRTFIRESLVPAERRVTRARRALKRVEAGRQDDEATIVKRRETLKDERAGLVVIYNQRILDTLTGAVLAVAPADSSGYYRFDTLSPARYHLYLESPGHVLTTIDLRTHSRRDLSAGPEHSPLLGGANQAL